jgi:hypothetical protein
MPLLGTGSAKPEDTNKKEEKLAVMLSS